jgi:AraC-like DNA-binding protein
MSERSSLPDYLTSHCRLVTTDLDLARERVGQMWERHRSELTRGRRYGIAWHQAGFARSTLSFVRTPSSIHVTCGPMSQTFHVTLQESGRVRHRICRQEAIATAGCAVVHVPGDELELEIEPFAALILSFDADLVFETLQQRYKNGSPSWPGLREFRLDTPAGAAMRSLCRWTAHQLDRPESEIVTSAGAASSLERTLLMLLLDCIDGQYPLDRGRVDALPQARVRQIEDWIDGHIFEAIAVEEMAKAAGVSVRSLQIAFRRFRGCTPMQFVLRRRLEAAHKALCTAKPGMRVTQIASECGFFNFGRFAARYRTMFGELPSETLTRCLDRTA